MTTSLRTNRATWWALFGILALGLVMPLASATPAAFTQPNPNNPPETWAWGATWSASASGSGSVPCSAANVTMGTGSASIHAFLGYNVIVNQTNTSTTAFTLSEQKVLVASYFLQLSRTCATESGSLNLTAQGWEKDSGQASFVTTGTVFLNGTTPVAAVAVTDAQDSFEGNFTAALSAQASGVTSGTLNAYESAQATAQASIAFTPSLGLFPVTLVPNSWWNSTADWSAQGSYAVACHYGYSGQDSAGASANGGGNCGSSGSATGSGVVNLVRGADLGIDANGAVVAHGFHQVTLQFDSNFASTWSLQDGLFFVPAHADILASSTVSSASGAPATGAAVSSQHIDLDPHAGGHVGIDASAVAFAPNAALTLGLSSSLSAVASPASVSSAAVVPSGVPQFSSTTVQGQPESPAAAEQSNAALLGSGPTSPSHSGLYLLLGLVAVGAVVVAIVGAVAVERSRRPKNPVGGYSTRPPSAFLMNNTPTTPPAGGARPGQPSRPAGQQDPLGHLY